MHHSTRFLALPVAAGLMAVSLLACSSTDEGTHPVAGGGMSSTSSGTGGAAGAGGAGGAGGHQGGAAPIGGDRPVTVFVPSSYKQGTPTPLVLLLHGYSASGVIQEAYFQLQPLAESRGFLYAHPDGLVNSQGDHYWNATDACCNFDGTKVDDSAYLERVIDDIKARYSVDPKRVFIVGHSNGGFMSHRMACDHADTVAAIVSLAGAMNADLSKCTPKEPVSVLEIHALSDETIAYNGGMIKGHPYPSAPTTAADWVTLDKCTGTPSTGPDRDLTNNVDGNDTTEQIWDKCAPGGHVELWTMASGVGHVPGLTKDFAPAVIDFLLAHPKP